MWLMLFLIHNILFLCLSSLFMFYVVNIWYILCLLLSCFPWLFQFYSIISWIVFCPSCKTSHLFSPNTNITTFFCCINIFFHCAIHIYIHYLLKVYGICWVNCCLYCFFLFHWLYNLVQGKMYVYNFDNIKFVVWSYS